MNILFVGDFRPAANYGSIATTECLLNMVYPLLSDKDELRIIDRRSYDSQTPESGYDTSSVSRYKKIVRKIVPQRMRTFIKHVPQFTPTSIEDYRQREHVPSLYSEYPWYVKKYIHSGGGKFEKRLLDWADFVLINGEGTIVKGTDRYGVYNRGGRYTIWMAYLAKSVFHKPTCVVNLTIDPGNRDGMEMVKAVFPLVDYLCTREPLSHIKLKENGVNNSIFVPDALFSYTPQADWHPSAYLSSVIDFDKPYIVLGDSTALNSNSYQDAVRWDIVATYSILYSKLKKSFPQVVFLDGFNGKNAAVNKFILKNKIHPIRLQNTTYHDLYYVFKHSQLFISGRWHASVLATLSSTPVLLYGADSHKTQALYSILDYSFPFFETQALPLHIDEMIDCAKKISVDLNLRRSISIKTGMLRKESFKNVEYLKTFLNR